MTIEDNQSSFDNALKLEAVAIAGLVVAGLMSGSAASGYHPYAFYQWLRWAVFLGAGFGAWRFGVRNWWLATLLLGLLSILFNPFNPFRLSRYQWQPYDVAGAIVCFVTAALLAVVSFRRR